MSALVTSAQVSPPKFYWINKWILDSYDSKNNSLSNLLGTKKTPTFNLLYVDIISFTRPKTPQSPRPLLRTIQKELTA